MLMFFYSADHSEVEQVRNELIEAGIPCEIHEFGPAEGLAQRPGEEELWIRNDDDSHRALMLCAALGLGFAKRTLPLDCFAELPPESDVEPAPNGESPVSPVRD